MVVGVLVFIPVVGLAGFHWGLVCMGRTTNEHVSRTQVESPFNYIVSVAGVMQLALCCMYFSVGFNIISSTLLPIVCILET